MYTILYSISPNFHSAWWPYRICSTNDMQCEWEGALWNHTYVHFPALSEKMRHFWLQVCTKLFTEYVHYYGLGLYYNKWVSSVWRDSLLHWKNPTRFIYLYICVVSGYCRSFISLPVLWFIALSALHPARLHFLCFLFIEFNNLIVDFFHLFLHVFFLFCDDQISICRCDM